MTMLNLTTARTIADSATLLRVATGSEIADALDTLALRGNAGDSGRVAALREALTATRH
jgi:hypothetical protein